MSRRTSNVLWILGIVGLCAVVGIGVIMILPHRDPRSSELDQGSELVAGVVTKLPIETKSGTAYLEFERDTGKTNWARVPDECGDTIQLGSRIEVWVDTLRADGLIVAEGEPYVYAQNAVVKCATVSDPSYAKY